MSRFIIVIVLALIVVEQTAKAHDVGAKTNILYEATANTNVGSEIGLASRLTFDALAIVNAWNVSGERKCKHWFALQIVTFKAKDHKPKQIV